MLKKVITARINRANLIEVQADLADQPKVEDAQLAEKPVVTKENKDDSKTQSDVSN